MHTHAVLHQQAGGDYYAIIGTENNTILYAPSLESLHKAMEDLRLDILWVMPGCSFSKNIREFHFNELDAGTYNWYVPHGIKQVEKPPYGARINYNRPKSFNRFIMFPEHREWTTSSAKNKGRWYVESPADLLQTINYLQTEYQTNILWSPSHVGLDCLREIHSKQERNIQPLPQEQVGPFLKIARDMCNWVAWKAATLSDGKYVVGFDKNAQFLGAAGSVELGNGGYEEVNSWEEVPGCPGFWQYRIMGYELSKVPYWAGIDMPCPLDRAEGWAHIDLIQCAQKMGVIVAIKRGIIWKEHKRYLREWSNSMWEHRFNLTYAVSDYNDAIARHNAAGTSKVIPNSMIGRFATESSGEYYHPDWNRAIVNRATANQMYTLMKLYRDFHISPVLVSKDAFYIVTNQEDINQAIPGFLANRDKQCGYKPIGIAPLNSVIQQAFQSDDVSRIEQIIKEEMKHGRQKKGKTKHEDGLSEDDRDHAKGWASGQVGCF